MAMPRVVLNVGGQEARILGRGKIALWLQKGTKTARAKKAKKPRFLRQFERNRIDFRSFPAWFRRRSFSACIWRRIGRKYPAFAPGRKSNAGFAPSGVAERARIR
jgi:ribosomal protein L32E